MTATGIVSVNVSAAVGKASIGARSHNTVPRFVSLSALSSCIVSVAGPVCALTTGIPCAVPPPTG
jgi:hypothetical protein